MTPINGVLCRLFINEEMWGERSSLASRSHISFSLPRPINQRSIDWSLHWAGLRKSSSSFILFLSTATKEHALGRERKKNEKDDEDRSYGLTFLASSPTICGSVCRWTRKVALRAVRDLSHMNVWSAERQSVAIKFLFSFPFSFEWPQTGRCAP